MSFALSVTGRPLWTKGEPFEHLPTYLRLTYLQVKVPTYKSVATYFTLACTFAALIKDLLVNAYSKGGLVCKGF